MNLGREATLLASGTRTTTQNSVDQNSAGNTGLMVFLDVTAVPTVETLTVSVQAKDPASLKYTAITTFTAQSATGTYVHTLYPGAAETASTAGHEVQALVLPRTYRVTVTHSASGSFTYSLGIAELT